MEIFEKYAAYPLEGQVEAQLGQIQQNAAQRMDAGTFRKAFSLIDLTTLSHLDTPNSGRAFAQKVNDFAQAYPEMPNVAAICVYPTLVADVADVLEVEDVEIASVAGGFPSSQTFVELKMAETKMAVDSGATEIDMVISVGAMREGNFAQIFDEVRALKSAADPAHLKVILESGSLSAEQIWQASMLSLEAGADFIKTSTGKTEPAATPEAALIMCHAIRTFYQETGRKAGFKPAGGIKAAADAVLYLSIVKDVLGDEWLCPELFRLGASSLANNLLTEIAKTEGKHENINFF